MNRLLPTAVLALAMAAFATSPSLAQEASVTFEFQTGSTGGTVLVALFDSAEAYDRNQPVRVAAVAAETQPVMVVFEGLADGDYAMKSFHDRNGDGEMNTNPFGMPVEPYAFSNNAIGNMGPADWNRARFAVTGPVVQTITLR